MNGILVNMMKSHMSWCHVQRNADLCTQYLLELCSMFIQEKQMKLYEEKLLLFFDGFAVLRRKRDKRWLQPQKFYLTQQ